MLLTCCHQIGKCFIYRDSANEEELLFILSLNKTRSPTLLGLTPVHEDVVEDFLVGGGCSAGMADPR